MNGSQITILVAYAVALVTDRVTNGKGAMLPSKGLLSAAQIRAVAEYVGGG